MGRNDRRGPVTSGSASTLPSEARPSTASCSWRPAAGPIDTFAPLRALRWKRTSRDGRRRPGRLTSLGPPEAAGRWSSVPAPTGSPTERTHAVALALLDRYGVVTREAVAGEGIEGGFSAVYPVLRALEEAGRIRRGYFVDGLGAAQFALPGALDRLRALREPEGEPGVHVLAATDPA